ncbi:hypothetical protein [Methylobacterium sp. CCH5-D2]|uniref:hypothetical protein n=1 Tax=Methylobacterium sp. CCH5-D2 TaxID=1768765 RepID=UPI00083175F3|nr:hypothetical protein [Methylobacterium sp. CCH5-D2]
MPHVPTHADPIQGAITDHRKAWAAFQVAPAGNPSLVAEQTLDGTLSTLLLTPCKSRGGAVALLQHLQWWIAEEAPYADSFAPLYAFAETRAADLALFLNAQPPADVEREAEARRVAHAPRPPGPPANDLCTFRDPRPAS